MSGPADSHGTPAKKAPAPAPRKKASPAAEGTKAAPSPAPAKGPTAKKGAAPTKRPATARAVNARTAGTKAPSKAAPSRGAAAAPSEQEAIDSRFFKRAKSRAEKVLSDPEKMRDVAAQAARKSDDARGGPLGQVLEEVAALVRLVVAYARGTYRDVPLQTMIWVLAGLIYWISPADLIPDFIPVAGYLDDAAVLAFVVRTVRKELDDFTAWETGRDELQADGLQSDGPS